MDKFSLDLAVAIIATFLSAFLGTSGAIFTARLDRMRTERKQAINCLNRVFIDLNRRRALSIKLQQSDRPNLDRAEDQLRVKQSVISARDICIEASSSLPESFNAERIALLHFTGLFNDYLEREANSSSYNLLAIDLSKQLNSQIMQLKSNSIIKGINYLSPGEGAINIESSI